MKNTVLFAIACALTAVLMFTDVPWATSAINGVIGWLQSAPSKL